MKKELKEEEFLIPKMTCPEVRDAIKKTDIVLVPVGSTEQHGPHCPINTDALIGYETASRAIKKLYKETGQLVLMAPPLPIGMSLHHMAYPGTISLQPETLVNVLVDVCLGLDHHGFRKIVIVNSHGGNNMVLDMAVRKIFEKTKSHIYAMTVWLDAVSKEENVAKKILKAGAAGSGHACETETSLLMAFGVPVRMNKIPKKAVLPKYPMPDFVGFSVAKYSGVNFTGNWNVEDLNIDGYLGDPTVATKETGEKILEYRVGLMVEFLKQLSKLPPRT